VRRGRVPHGVAVRGVAARGRAAPGAAVHGQAVAGYNSQRVAGRSRRQLRYSVSLSK
jgi:hypothetical protein